MNSLRVVCAALAITGGAAVAERVIDPFERYEADYAPQGPQHRSEVFYMSVNEVDSEGNQVGDDRLGDAALAFAGGLALATLAMGYPKPEAGISPDASIQ